MLHISFDKTLERELDRKFNRLRLRNDQLEPILLKGARTIRDTVELLAPVGTGPTAGRLRREGPAAGVLRNQPPMRPATIAFIRRRRAPEAKFVERGTRPHRIEAKSGGTLRFDAGRVFRKTVLHPGAKARRFFSDAVATMRSRVRRQIINDVRTMLTNKWKARG